jgi:pyochelin synthetase
MIEHCTESIETMPGWERLEARVRDQAAARPHAIAIQSTRQTVTYGELSGAVAELARRLQGAGARPGQLVAVVMDKGWEQVVAVLGVLAAGAAYLPIDAGLPQERIDHLLAHGEVEIVLTQPGPEARLSWPEDIERMVVDEALLRAPARPWPSVGTPEDIAYVIYTSGSTGLPKGVTIDHFAAMNTIDDINRRFAVSPGDVVLGVSSLSFDLSVWDIFGVLGAGGVLALPDHGGPDPAGWAELCARYGVTLWDSVPALMDLVTEYASARPELLRSLRLVMLSGDWIPLSLPDRIRRLCDASVVSLGGATEASIWSIGYPIERVDPSWSSIPYGRALSRQSFHVLDDELEPLPVGERGALYIGGVGLARGYWRDEERTQCAFRVHPRTGERLYRTGDLGRLMPDGNIEFLGREDQQVKIQGYRVELGEIEAALLEQPGVENAVAAARGERDGDRLLVAYVVSSEPVSAQELEAALARKLPSYMIPMIVQLDALPLTANGKVDRRALPDPFAARAPAAELSAPGSLEQQLVALVARTLGRSEAEVLELDQLLALGATSMAVARIATALEHSFGVRLAIADIYRDPTVSALLRACESAEVSP